MPCISCSRSRSRGALFHDYTHKGYLEVERVEALKTFADGRTDIFIYNGVLNDYLEIIRIERPFELLDKYEIGYVLFPINTPLSYLLDHSASWRTIYQDKQVKLYQRVPVTATSREGLAN